MPVSVLFESSVVAIWGSFTTRCPTAARVGLGEVHSKLGETIRKHLPDSFAGMWKTFML